MLLKDLKPGRAYSNNGSAYTELLESGIKRLDSKPQYLWHSNYYDGPLSGVCLYNNRECWFECVDELDYIAKDEDGEDDYFVGRVFAILELQNDQFKLLKKNHNIFRKYVGTHTDYKDNERISGSPPSSWIIRILRKCGFNTTNYYFKVVSKKLKSQSFDDNKVIAWYGSSHFNFDAAIMKDLSE